MNENKHESVFKIWNNFIEENEQYRLDKIPPSFYFCDNEKDADECADLVLKDIKRATATSLWWLNKNNERLPKIGDRYIVTNWNGIARVIIQTIKIEKVPYNQITSKFAEAEGEGDKSLEYWNKVHWDYYSREMKPFGETPSENMIIICEYFETIWAKK